MTCPVRMLKPSAPLWAFALLAAHFVSSASAQVTWTQVASGVPAPRNTGALGQVLGDTWEWDGTSWVQRNPMTSPPARTYAELAYDSRRGRVVLFGGYDGSQYLGDTWEWDGTTWVQRAPFASPSPRQGHAVAFDAARGRVVAFGGYSPTSLSAVLLSDTWEYGPTNPAAFTPFGAGCAGSAGVPALSNRNGQLPWIGETFTLQLGSLPPGNAAFLFFGLSNTIWGALALPLNLGVIKMPGCALFTSVDLVAALANPSGTASLALAVPNNLWYPGQSIYAQGFVLDPPANALGAVVSNAGEVKFGSK